MVTPLPFATGKGMRDSSATPRQHIIAHTNANQFLPYGQKLVLHPDQIGFIIHWASEKLGTLAVISAAKGRGGDCRHGAS
jgi:hypothetical protein